MESSDDGDPATHFFTKTVLFFLLILSFSIFHQQQKRPDKPPLLLLSKAVTAPPVKVPVTAKAPPKGRKKKLYLTFDDGPNKGTSNVLHIVKDEGVPVSFFIVGEHVFASRTGAQVWDSLKIAENIALCNHSFTHADNRYERFYSRPDSVVTDFQRSADSLDLDNAIVRTPGRNIWRIDTVQFTDLEKSAAAADSLQSAGFIVMGWDLEWKFDHKTMSLTTTAESMMALIDSSFQHNRTKNKDHLVLLAHDQVYAKSGDSTQLRQLLQLLKKREDLELTLVNRYPGTHN